jgi:hypothetical protein
MVRTDASSRKKIFAQERRKTKNPNRPLKERRRVHIHTVRDWCSICNRCCWCLRFSTIPLPHSLTGATVGGHRRASGEQDEKFKIKKIDHYLIRIRRVLYLKWIWEKSFRLIIGESKSKRNSRQKTDLSIKNVHVSKEHIGLIIFCIKTEYELEPNITISSRSCQQYQISMNRD